MKPLVITETTKTPFVHFDNKEGKLLIGGNCIPENAYAFYESVMSWLENYIEETTNDIQLHLIFELLNANSKKNLFHLFKSLEKHYLNGKIISVKWYYEENDDEIPDTISLFRQKLQIPITDVIIDSIDYKTLCIQQ